MRFTRFICMVILGLVLILVANSTAAAQKGKPQPPPTGNPAIAYSYPKAKQWDLMVMDANGSNQRAVISQSLTDNTEPDWSPDGTHLVFSRFERKSGIGGTYTVKLDGKELTRVGNGPYGRPAWSPVPLGEGEDRQCKIAYTSMVANPDGTRQSELFLVNQNGSGLTQLTNTALYETDVDWSPSADRLAVGTYDGTRSDIQIYQIDCTTSQCRGYDLGNLINGKVPQLEGKDVAFFHWAKTQDKLVVSAQTGAGPNYDLWILNVNNPLDITRLTVTPWNEWWPSFSPDDSQIVFSRGQSGGFYVMNSNAVDSDGSDQMIIAMPPNNGIFWAPNWRRNP